MKKRIAGLLIITICAMALVSCGGKGGKTLVSVNGKDITQGDLEFLGEINPRIKGQIATPFGQKQILNNLVEQETLYQAAIKKGVQRDPLVKAKIDLYKKVIIAQSLIEAEIAEAAKKNYEENKSEFEKLKMSHIMIKYDNPKDKKKVNRTKAQALVEANNVKARLDKGEEFAKVAEQASDDKKTSKKGGDLGMVSKDDKRMEGMGYGPLLEKAFALEVGKIAGPIETEKGYHLIAVTEGAQLQSYEEVEQTIVFKIRGEARTKLIADIKKDAKIIFADEKKKENKPPKIEKPEGVKEEPKVEEAKPETAEPEAAAPASASVEKPNQN